MKFSIIVPVYNVEKYLPRCLDSVLDQEFDDYEIIAVDDESPDNSIDILNEYQKKTEKLKIIRQKNKGLGGARNTGIKEAAGEYLIFLDSDDYISPKMLSSLNEYLKKEDLDILAFDCERVTESGQTIEKVSVKDYQDQYTSLNAKQYLLFEPTSCVKTYRRTLYTEHRIEFPEKLWYEDLATTLKLSAYATKIGYLKEVFYYYVQHYFHFCGYNPYVSTNQVLQSVYTLPHSSDFAGCPDRAFQVLNLQNTSTLLQIPSLFGY